MAPMSPQGNARTLRSPAAGSPVPLTGIPPPASAGLQRRSLGQPPSAQSAYSAKHLQNMSSPEQQSLLAEAISIHSPGLLDTARSRADSVGSPSGPAAYPSPLPTSFSPGIPASNRTHSPTAFASPLSYRASQTTTPTPRRPSASGATTPHSAISPLTTSFLQQSHSSSASSSPVTADSPSTSTSRLSRLSLGANAGSNPASASNTRLMMKQPLFHRPPSADQGASGPSHTANSAGTLPTIPASAAPSLAEDHNGQSQLPPSLEGIELGDRVVVESMGLTGYLRFVGTAAFKTGIWAGIELDTPTGKNDGSVAGVAYFNCRPNCGIFVLAAKIVKTEMLIPFSSAPNEDDAQATSSASAARPPSLQEDTHSTPPPANNAAQAASRITAGSRASKYIGVTASQLKQRHTMPPPANTRPLAQQPQQSQQQQTTTSDTVQGSPTSARTLANGSSRVKTTSPTPVTYTGRTGLGSRLSQPGSKTSLLSMANKPGTTLARSASNTTSPPSSMTNRPRTSPTRGRLMSSPRRLSSRASDTSDNGGSSSYNNNNSNNNMSASSSPKNLLDQATLIQMAESPKGDLAVQLQQLQLDFGVAVAENNMLKTEMNQTKSQLEMTRLLEKRDLSYDERVFLSKSLGRGGIDERLGQELEELHSMKDAWEKEKSAKDSEIKAITDKMTEAWLEAARSQKERTALLQEKEELENRLKELQESGGRGDVQSGSDPDQGPSVGDEERQAQHQLAIDSLTRDLHAAEERIEALELKLQQYASQAAEDDAALQEREEALTETRVHYAEQLTLLEQERDDLQERLDDLELVLKVTTESLQSKLEAAQRDTAHSEEQLHEVQARLDHEAEVRRTKESEAESGHRQVEADLLQSQSLLAKTEKVAKEFEAKAKEYESTIAKREQEIASLKVELDDLAGMVQSEEVDRMRKVWEHEKKRLEDEVAESKVVITDLRQEIQHLKTNEEDLLGQITDLSSAISTYNVARSEMEAEMERLQKSSDEAQEQFLKDLSEWQGKAAESETALQIHAAETKIKMEHLEATALSAETLKEQCEVLQLELNQKTARAEDAGVEVAEAVVQRVASQLEASAVRKELEDTIARHQEDLEKVQNQQKAAEDEKLGLMTKVSELEAALALSASVSAKATSEETDAGELSAQNRSDLQEEIEQLKKMVHDLTRENVTVANVNKKLMQEHDNLMEAHKHVETECLKLMDEVERLHAESLTAASMDGESEGAEEKDDEPTESMENIEPKSSAKAFKETMPETHGPSHVAPPSHSQSVIRLEGLLKEKQALLDRLTQAHASEMRDLRQRYIDLDRSKAYEVGQLNKELTELESLIESKIFHEADLEEEVQRKQKEIDWLRHEISDLKNHPSTLAGSTLAPPSRLGSTNNNSHHGDYRPSSSSAAVREGFSSNGTKAESALFCEICEVEGHDIITCAAVFGANNNNNHSNKSGLKMSASRSSLISTPVPSEMEEERPYCENCEEFGLHYTDDCPNESLTY
ncbi:CAP-Gly domain-containing linker protein 4 [Mortierella alpina]|uniref:CAP-Gly domain-containing linker protein 4 n=1 Tax=Mortierella alpina TaxID=64518 RepID=A0A9P6J7G2_MORAP|nr:CAP-Gly domain-containing linker protein 4 [Mortierella alpina]